MTASGTSEAEYVASSEVVNEVIFLRLVQEFVEPSMRVDAECFYDSSPPHVSDGFKTDFAPFLPFSYCFCWSDLFMWIVL